MGIRTMSAEPETDHRSGPESLVESTVEAVFETLPLGLSGPQAAAAAGRLTNVAIRQPREIARHTGKLCAEELKVLFGNSDVEPERKDRRFGDEWFAKNPLYRRTAQAYLAWNREVYELLEDLDLDDKSKERARFVLGLVTETVAPTNTLLGNPAALRKAVKTRGRSVFHGLRHLAHDIRNNGGLPSMVDTRPFALGDTMAATPGGVVFRNEVLEVLQYEPQTKKVRKRPVVVVPPQINKYYILDLAPGRSLAEYAVQHEQQVFMISWRNPEKEMRDWDMDTYATAILEAVDAARQITGSDDVNIMGVCAGGITTAALLGHLASLGDKRVHCATFLVTVLDWSVLSTVGTFVSAPVVAASIQRSQRDGVLRGKDLARLFAWLRPNDLVWNYWINNYLMGQNPAAFDVLAWNVDATNLPAGLHADFMHLAQHNSMTTDGETEVLGTPINLEKVDMDNFVVGAINDHITPWQGCYETTRLLGGDSTFVLSNAGHIVAMVNPPGGKKSEYLINPDAVGEEPGVWHEGAETVKGTWWDAWVEWIDTRSGAKVAAPAEVGDDDHPVILPAPGTYVRA
ncbi:class II poly(R)-hydroxyalkanoic acid synthase [soil metagenome]